jgi:hypothetical protein
LHTEIVNSPTSATSAKLNHVLHPDERLGFGCASR